MLLIWWRSHVGVFVTLSDVCHDLQKTYRIDTVYQVGRLSEDGNCECSDNVATWEHRDRPNDLSRVRDLFHGQQSGKNCSQLEMEKGREEKCQLDVEMLNLLLFITMIWNYIARMQAADWHPTRISAFAGVMNRRFRPINKISGEQRIFPFQCTEH